MSLEKVPFRSYSIGEKDPFTTGKVMTVRLSASEYKGLMAIAKVLRISRDSTALKKLALIGENVIKRTFGLDLLGWLLDDKRIIDESKLDRIDDKNKRM